MTQRTTRAPGRVNLIGDHTDYQDGWCLPVAIDREVVLTSSARADGRVVVRSDALGSELDTSADAPIASVVPAWGRLVVAVLRVLADRGRPTVGFNATVASTIPVGSGLSSSAAFAVAVAMTADPTLAGGQVALVAQAAEHLASGVPCGLMDQLASVHGRAGHALLVDCRSRHVDPLPLPDSVEILVVHSGLARQLEHSAYAQRRAACELASANLDIATLRDATAEQVAHDPIARHVVSENARVLECAAALRRGDVDAAGRSMLASHASLRSDFRVSTPELDLLVDLLVGHGALGARLTGAGFGGCVVALVPTDVDIAEPVSVKYATMTSLTADAFTVRATDGAATIEE
ncbi:MAG: galactokinase [Actinomycetota bacterium]